MPTNANFYFTTCTDADWDVELFLKHSLKDTTEGEELQKCDHPIRERDEWHSSAYECVTQTSEKCGTIFCLLSNTQSKLILESRYCSIFLEIRLLLSSVSYDFERFQDLTIEFAKKFLRELCFWLWNLQLESVTSCPLWAFFCKKSHQNSNQLSSSSFCS